MSDVLSELIHEILLLEAKEKKKPGAGFVIVREFEDGWRVLGLKLYGKYDIPKGGIEEQDGDNRFTTAQRECAEECDIQVAPTDLMWGTDPIQLRHLTIFLAATDQDPVIVKNKKTGIFEHHGADWLHWDSMLGGVYPYLKPAIEWAKLKVEVT